MQSFLNSPLGVYLTMAVLYVITGLALRLIHQSIKRVEDWVSSNAPAQDATKINDLLNVIDRITEAAVQDANSRMVIDLKTQGLFTKETADSLKQSVISDVLKNMGPLKETAIAALGPLETIIGHFVETNVLQYKPQVNQLVQTAKAQQLDSSSSGTSANQQSA